MVEAGVFKADTLWARARQAQEQGRALAVGHVIPIASRHEIVNPVFADFIAGAGESYSRNGYDMVLSVVPDDAEEEGGHGALELDPQMGLARLIDAAHREAQAIETPQDGVQVVGQAQAEQVQHRRVEVVDRRDVLDRLIAEAPALACPAQPSTPQPAVEICSVFKAAMGSDPLAALDAADGEGALQESPLQRLIAGAYP